MSALARVERGAPAGRAFLETPLADALSVLLFAAGAAWARVWLLPAFFLPPPLTTLLGLGLALLGPVGCGIERGLSRPPGWGAALALGLGCAAGHAGTRAWLSGGGWPLLLEAALLAPLGAVAARAATRFDRGEAGWREAARIGPPTGTAPLAVAIATAWRAPRPLELLLLPLSWALRLPALLLIRLYQLTASRLMPPACRFEPTCSRYGYEAYLRHGCLRGTLLTGLRVLRCSPVSSGGYDPVPAAPGCRSAGYPRQDGAPAGAPAGKDET